MVTVGYLVVAMSNYSVFICFTFQILFSDLVDFASKFKLVQFVN